MNKPKIDMSNPLISEFIDEVKVSRGLSIVDDDLNERDYEIILRRTVRELGAYATQVSKATLTVKGGVVSTKDLDLSIVVGVYDANPPQGVSSGAQSSFSFSPSLHTNTDSLTIGLYGNMRLNELRVSDYSLGVANVTNQHIEYRFDKDRQVILCPSILDGWVTISYMQRVADIEYMINDSYWYTQLFELYNHNLNITLGTIYSKMTVKSSPYELDRDLKAEGERGKAEFMERLRESLFTFAPKGIN